MSVMNEETRGAWQAIANDLSKQRPYPGRRVRVISGRKHKGKEGVVARHQLDHYEDAFRYGNEASQHMTQMAGRDGYVVMVRPDDGKPFWVKARYVLCIDDAATCDRCGAKHLAMCAPADVASRLSPGAAACLLWADESSTDTEPAWLEPDQDPNPALEVRRAGCARLDVFAVMPTEFGRHVAAELRKAD